MKATNEEDALINRLINACAVLQTPKSDIPYKCLLDIGDCGRVVNCICEFLRKGRSPPVKLVLSQLLQTYFLQKKGESVWTDVEFVIELLVFVIATTPVVGARTEIKLFKDFVLEVVARVDTGIIPKLFNRIVKTTSPYGPLAIVLLTAKIAKLQQNTVKYVLALMQDPQPLYLTATSELFSMHKYADLAQASKDEFEKLHGFDIIQRSVLVGLSQHIETRIMAIELVAVVCESFGGEQADKIARGVVPALVAQINEKSDELRTLSLSTLSGLANFPTREIGNTISCIAAHFEKGSDGFTSAAFNFLEKQKGDRALKTAVSGLLDSDDSYVPGLCFCAYLGYLGEADEKLEQWFPVKPNHCQAVAVVRAMDTLAHFGLFKMNTFRASFRCLLAIFSRPKLAGDSALRRFIFDRLIKNIASRSGDFPSVVSALLIDFLPKVKDTEIMINLAPIAVSVIDRKSELISTSMSDYAVLYVGILLKFLDDVNMRQAMMPYLAMISRADTFDVNLGLCEIIDQTVPVNFVDAVRTEAILRSQHSPVGSLIAVALPHCALFLPTLCRVVRDLIPENHDLTLAFVMNAAKRSLDAFLPHLMRFTEPVEKVNSFLFVSYKEKNVMHLREVFACIAYICTEVGPSQKQTEIMLDIATAAFPKEAEDIQTVMPEALSAIQKLANAAAIKWNESLLKCVFAYPCLSPSFKVVFEHMLPDSTLLTLACESYAGWIISNPANEEEDIAMCEALFAVSGSDTTLGIVLTSMMKFFSGAPDAVMLMKLCLRASKIYHDRDDDLQIDLRDFVIGLGQFAFSGCSEHRLLVRDIYYSIFSLRLPADSDSPITKSADELSPASVTDFAAALFSSVFGQFKVEFLVDLCVYITHCRPLKYGHALMLHTAASVAAESLVIGETGFLQSFLEIADSTVNETRVLLIDTVKILAKSDMSAFLHKLLGAEMSQFRSDCVLSMVSDREYKAKFLANYGEIILSLTFPIQPREQQEFLSLGYFQALITIIQTDDTPHESFGAVVSYILVWLSLLFTASDSDKQRKLSEELIACFDGIFSRLAKGEHDPIEFSLKSHQTLYQSLGHLVNALLRVESGLLVDFCKSCFVLLKSHLQTTVLISALCMSRLLHRIAKYDYPDVLLQLRVAVALSFVVSCDENCRIMCAVMNDLFSQSILQDFTDDDFGKVLQGAIRGVVFPGADLKAECVGFLYKVIVAAPQSVLEKEQERLWYIIRDQAMSALSLTAATSLLKIDRNATYLTGNIGIDKLIFATSGENQNIARTSLVLLETLCEVKGVEQVITSLGALVHTDGGLVTVCISVIDRITKQSVSVALLDLVVAMILGCESARVRDKGLGLFLVIIEDGDHVIRTEAAERLRKFIT